MTWCEICEDGPAAWTWRSRGPLGRVEVRMCAWCKDRPETAEFVRRRVVEVARAHLQCG